MYQTRDFEIFPICALEKVRGLRPQLYEDENTVLSGERASFQVAYRSVGKTLTDLFYTIDPFFITDCMGKFQSGDSFVVYPDENGVIESMRNEAFLQGVQDYLALKLL